MNNLVHICSKPPFETIDGGSKAILQLHNMLAELPYNLKTIVFYSDKHPVTKANYPAETLFLKTPAKSGFSAVFGSTRKKTSLITERHFSKHHQKAIERFCNQAQVVIFDGLIAASYLTKITTEAKKIYRAHNIEYSTYLSLAQELNPIKKLIYTLAAKQLEKFELSFIKSSDSNWIIAPEDLLYFNSTNSNSLIIPYCVSGGPITNSLTQNKRRTIGLLAAFDWLPNYNAVNECVAALMGTLEKEKIQFLIAGKGSENLQFKSSYIKLLGPIEHLENFYNQVDLVINPVKSGGGLKIKTLEAMQYSKPVIGFKEAFRGHDQLKIPNNNLQIHDSYESLQNAVVKLINSDYLVEIGQANQAYIQANFNSEQTKLAVHQNIKFIAE